MAHHVQAVEHPNDSAFSSLQIFAIEMVLMKIFFLEERPGCNAIFVTIFKGLNVREDIQSMIRTKILLSFHSNHLEFSPSCHRIKHTSTSHFFQISLQNDTYSPNITLKSVESGVCVCVCMHLYDIILYVLIYVWNTFVSAV